MVSTSKTYRIFPRGHVFKKIVHLVKDLQIRKECDRFNLACVVLVSILKLG